MVYEALFSTGLSQRKASQTRRYTHAWMVCLRTVRGLESSFCGFSISRELAEATVANYEKVSWQRRSNAWLSHSEVVETSGEDALLMSA